MLFLAKETCKTHEHTGLIYQLHLTIVQLSYMQQLGTAVFWMLPGLQQQLVASPVDVQQLVLVSLISADRSYVGGVHGVLMCISGQCLIAVVCRCT